MNNGQNGKAAAFQPSVMNYRKLQSRKSWLGLRNADIAKAAGACEKTVSAFMNGDDAVRPEIQDAIAKALKLRRTIDFEPLEIDRGFADTVAEAGLKYSIRYEPTRNVWIVVQEAALGSHPVGEFYGLENERLARFCAERLNEAVSSK